MWWPVIQALAAHLQAWPDLADTTVEVWGGASTPEKRTIRITRAGSNPPAAVYGQTYKQVVWVECWEYSEDADGGIGYALLSDLEEKTQAALRAFGQQRQAIDGKHVRTTVERVDSDGDIFRPSIGSLTRLTIEWRPV